MAPEATSGADVARHWAAWVGLWSVGASALLWATAAAEALEILRERRAVAGDELAAPDSTTRLALALGIVLVPVFAGTLAAWWRAPAVRRGLLLLGGLALLVSGWAWRDVPDAGPWWPGLAVLAGALTLLGLTADPRKGRQGSTGGGRVAGLLLALAGAAVALLGWRGLDYQQWHAGSHTAPMWVALLAGALLVPVALVAHRLPGGRRTSVGVVVLAGVAAVVTLAPATLWMLDLGQLQRHEESESGWEAMVLVLPGTGFLAAAVAAGRRSWPLVGLSLATGLGLGAGAVLRSELARFLW